MGSLFKTYSSQKYYGFSQFLTSISILLYGIIIVKWTNGDILKYSLTKQQNGAFLTSIDNTFITW